MENKDKIEEIIQEKKVAVFIFYTKWAGVWQAYEKIINEIIQEYPDILFYKIDAEQEAFLVQKYHIRTVPTTFFYKNKTLIETKTGLIYKNELVETIQRMVDI